MKKLHTKKRRINSKKGISMVLAIALAAVLFLSTTTFLSIAMLQRAPVIAVPQAIRLGHAPIHQRIVVLLRPRGFIRRDSDILHDIIFSVILFQVFINNPGF